MITDDDIRDLASWTKDAFGKFVATPTERFWFAWNESKMQLKGAGVFVRKEDDGSYLAVWNRDAIPTERIINAVNGLAPAELPEAVVGKLLAWQPKAVSQLVASMLANGVAVDASMTGIGKTAHAIATAVTLGLTPVVICTKPGIPGWHKMFRHFGIEGMAVNWEKVRTGKTEIGHWPKLPKKSRFEWRLDDDCILIFDEFHRASGLNTQQSKMAVAAKRQNIPTIALSATLADSVLKMRALGYLCGLYSPEKNFIEWAMQHGVVKGTRYPGPVFEFIGGPRVMKRIHAEMTRLGLLVRLKTSDIPEFPRAQIHADPVNFGDDQTLLIQREYENLAELVAKYGKLLRTAHDPMTELLRIRQKVELLKLPTIAEMARDAITEGNSVVIFLCFKASVYELACMLKTVSVITGDALGEKREKTRLAFQMNKERVIILTFGAGGDSIDLGDEHGEFPRLLLVAPTYSSTNFRQAIGRVSRAIDKSPAIVRVFYASNTVEADVLDAIEEKLANLDSLQDGAMTPWLPKPEDTTSQPNATHGWLD